MEFGPEFLIWLEITKVFVGFLTAVVIAVFGIFVQRAMKEFEHSQWRSQKLIEKRLAIYETLAPEFNDLLCYFTYVGSWKSQSPDSVLRKKRELDKLIYISAPLFSQEFFDECMRFQELCFEVNNGVGMDARLRTNSKDRREHWNGDWNDEWDKYFSKNISMRKEIADAYRKALHRMSIDIGVHSKASVPISTR